MCLHRGLFLLSSAIFRRLKKPGRQDNDLPSSVEVCHICGDYFYVPLYALMLWYLDSAAFLLFQFIVVGYFILVWCKSAPQQRPERLHEEITARPSGRNMQVDMWT
jgi:hypothetical protein